MRSRAPLLCCLLFLASACAHRVHIETEPLGATVAVGRKNRGPAPRDLTFLWLPFRPLKVRVSATGYRPVVLNVSRYAGLGVYTRELLGLKLKRLAGLAPRATIRVVLVREHDAVGTWTEEDITR